MKFHKLLLLVAIISLTGCEKDKDFSTAYQDQKISTYVTTTNSNVFGICTYDEDREAYMDLSELQIGSVTWGDFKVSHPTRDTIRTLEEIYPEATIYYNKKKDVILSIPMPEE